MSVFGIILVLIFPHSDWIRKDTPYLSVLTSNAGKCRPEYLRIRTLFTQWKWLLIFNILRPLFKIWKYELSIVQPDCSYLCVLMISDWANVYMASSEVKLTSVQISSRSNWAKWKFKPQWIFHINSKCP